MQRASDISIWKHLHTGNTGTITAVKHIYDDTDSATIQLHLQILILLPKDFNWDVIY